jgi:hypothetical protein
VLEPSKGRKFSSLELHNDSNVASKLKNAPLTSRNNGPIKLKHNDSALELPGYNS